MGTLHDRRILTCKESEELRAAYTDWECESSFTNLVGDEVIDISYSPCTETVWSHGNTRLNDYRDIDGCRHYSYTYVPEDGEE